MSSRREFLESLFSLPALKVLAPVAAWFGLEKASAADSVEPVPLWDAPWATPPLIPSRVRLGMSPGFYEAQKWCEEMRKKYPWSANWRACVIPKNPEDAETAKAAEKVLSHAWSEYYEKNRPKFIWECE